MKKWIILTICSVAIIYILVFSFASTNGVAYRSIGTSYNKFLFIPAKSVHFNVTFRSPYSGNLTLIDEKGKPLSPNKYIVSANGKQTGPSFTVNQEKIVHISIRCSKAVSPGKQYIQVRGGGPLVTHVYFRHHLNPFIAWLSLIMSILSVIALVWFMFLKRILYPTFKSGQKMVTIPNQSPIVIKMTGARMVVISSKPIRKSLWSTLIKGNVINKVHPAFESPVSFLPVRGRRILVKADESVYRISPNPMPGIGSATIDNIKNNINIKIN